MSKIDYTKVIYQKSMEASIDGAPLVLKSPSYRELKEWIENMPEEHLDDRIAVYSWNDMAFFYVENIGIVNDPDIEDVGWCHMMLEPKEF